MRGSKSCHGSLKDGSGIPQQRTLRDDIGGQPSAQDVAGRHSGCACPSIVERSLRYCGWKLSSKSRRASLKDVAGIPRHRTPREDTWGEARGRATRSLRGPNKPKIKVGAQRDAPLQVFYRMFRELIVVGTGRTGGTRRFALFACFLGRLTRVFAA